MDLPGARVAGFDAGRRMVRPHLKIPALRVPSTRPGRARGPCARVTAGAPMAKVRATRRRAVGPLGGLPDRSQGRPLLRRQRGGGARPLPAGRSARDVLGPPSRVQPAQSARIAKDPSRTPRSELVKM